MPVRKHVATGKPRGRVPKGDQDGPELSSEELSLFNDYVARQSNYGEKCQHHIYTDYLEQLRDGEVKNDVQRAMAVAQRVFVRQHLHKKPPSLAQQSADVLGVFWPPSIEEDGSRSGH